MKQRLAGAAVLVALAVIFLPMLVQGPAPDSGVSDVPLSMPDAPSADYETRDLPLAAPSAPTASGAVGMPSAVPGADVAADRPDANIDDDASPSASTAVPMPDDGAASTAALPAAPAAATALPATVAGGDYAVHFGSYGSSAGADRVLAALRAAKLPGYREQGLVAGKPIWRVRIGPYASRADAEAARLQAATVRGDVQGRVVTLDAPVAAAPASVAAKPVATPAIATTPLPQSSPPVAKTTAPPAQSVTSATPVTAAASTGFAVQLAAFSKPADATALRDKLRAAGMSAFTETVNTDKGSLTRVRVGPVATRAEADALKTQVKARVGIDGIVRPHP